MRGTTAGQKTGFYSFPYSSRKMTLDELCEYDSYFNPDNLATLQNHTGRSSFISTTTNVFGAGAWSLKSDCKPGKIYVIKVPQKDAYRIESPFGMEEFEYLIPDFVLPDEIMESFEYYDAKGIYNYLRTQGLNINLTDLDLPEGSFNNLDFYKKSIEHRAKMLYDPKHKIVSAPKSVKLFTGIDVDRLYDF